MVVLSKIKADRMHGWTKIVGNYSEGHLIEGKAAKKVKGGFIIDIGGIEAFLPASLSAFRGNPNDFIGKTMKFKIASINKSRKNIVLSRREAIQMEKEEIKVKLLDSLKVGEIVGGTVKNVTDFGAFIDLGGTDGLLHITDMSWSRINHPSEVVVMGDKIDVVVLGVDKESGKVSLGLKQKTPDPWLEVETKFPLGSKVKGKVVNLVPYGIFVELEKGIEALVHISELSWTKRISDPSELFAIGDMVEAAVLTVDSQNRKISLGIKQMEVNPWLDVESKYPPGTKVKGKVRALTDYGAFVELEEGIDGLIHASDMSGQGGLAVLRRY
jgi:small subunit ribosomal protein S1